MKINYNLAGEKRRELVKAISNILQVEPVYKKMPTCAYEIGDITVDKEGTLICEDGAKAERIAHNLIADGFIAAGETETMEPEIPAGETKEAADVDIDIPDSLTIEMPLEGFTDTALGNLDRLIASKATLIKKAVGADALPVERTETTLRFLWFRFGTEPEEVNAYSHFIGALCATAKEQHRVTAKEKPVDNEKFAFRVFLIRLGFVGDDYKAARRILLQNLSGNSAFKNGAPPKVESIRLSNHERGVE